MAALPDVYWIGRGNIVNYPRAKPEGYPLPIAADIKGQLPRSFGAKVWQHDGDEGEHIVQHGQNKRARSTDDSISFGGVSGRNFLVRNAKQQQ